MVFMFAGRMNMRTSPRTGGAFFQCLVLPLPRILLGGGCGDRGGEEGQMNGKEGGERLRRCRHLRICRQPSHFTGAKEREILEYVHM